MYTPQEILKKLQALQCKYPHRGTSITTYCESQVVTFLDYNPENRVTFRWYEGVFDGTESDQKKLLHDISASLKLQLTPTKED